MSLSAFKQLFEEKGWHFRRGYGGTVFVAEHGEHRFFNADERQLLVYMSNRIRKRKDNA